MGATGKPISAAANLAPAQQLIQDSAAADQAQLVAVMLCTEVHPAGLVSALEAARSAATQSLAGAVAAGQAPLGPPSLVASLIMLAVVALQIGQAQQPPALHLQVVAAQRKRALRLALVPAANFVFGGSSDESARH